MKKKPKRLALWLTLTGAIFSQVGKAQIYNVGNEDGFSIACAGPVDNELFLPIPLLYFGANCRPDGIIISWVIQNDKNSENIILERSFDGKKFHSINKTNADNRNAHVKYLDREKTSKVQYYRLKQERISGSPEYSAIISSVCQIDKCVVSPNPTTGVLTIQSEEPEGSIIIRDLTGRCIYACYYTQATQQIDARHLKDGIYSFEMHSTFLTLKQRIIIAR